MANASKVPKIAPVPQSLDVSSVEPPDAKISRQDWLFLIALASIAGLAELAIVIINLSTNPIYLDKGLHLPQLVGISLSVFFLAEALGNAPFGAISDRWGRRPMMVLGALLSVGTCVAMACLRPPTDGTGILLVSAAVLGLRVVDGIGAAMYWPALFASVGDRLPPERQAQGMSILNVTYLVGIAFGPVIGGLCNENLGRQFSPNQPERYIPSFMVAALCFGIIAMIAAIIAPRRPTHTTHQEIAAQTPDTLPDTSSGNPHTGTPLAAIQRAIREIPFLLLMGFLIFFASAGLIPPYLKNFIMHRFDVSESTFGTMLLYPAIIIAALSFPLGKFCDRCGKPRAIQIGLGIVSVALWALLVVQEVWAVIAIGSLLGIGFILAFPSYMAYVSEIAGPKERAGMIGAVRMAQGIGALSGAAISSTLYTADAKHLTIFVVASALITIGFALSLFVIRPLSPQISDMATSEERA
jgi:DHA1 family multidrug resistance protein-like MFS transporter